MGSASAKQELLGVTKRTEQRVGKITVSGRYHRLPKKLEDDYALESKVLGTGYNGKVHLGRDLRTNAPCAVKSFQLRGVDRESMKELERECEIFLSMDHPHIVRLMDVYESEQELVLIMECMDGGELFHRISARRKFSEKDASDAAFQMLLALNYLHSHGVVHRDIKLENFLYEHKASDHLKLIDFGFSKIWAPTKKMASSCGTLAYVAPEVLERSYTSQCDLWSLGVIVFILVFGYMPFQRAGVEEKQLMKQIKTGQYSIRQDAWSGVSSEAKQFVSQLLVVDPNARFTANQALQHDWIRKRNEIQSQDKYIDQAVVDSLRNFAKASAFRRACMAVMSWSLTSDDQAKVRDAFLEMDKNHDGKINLTEFKRVLQDEFRIEDDAVMNAFRALDLSHSDELHYRDFLTGMVSSDQLPFDENLLAQTFRRFDTDGSGYITTPNLEQVLGKTFEGRQVNDIMYEVDVDRDGRISYQEFARYLKDGTPTAHCPQEVSFTIKDQKSLHRSKVFPECHVPRLMQSAGQQRNSADMSGPRIEGEEVSRIRTQPQCTPCVLQ